MKWLYWGFCWIGVSVFSQLSFAEESSLFSLLKEKDHQLFSEGYDQCHAEVMEQLIADDFEFYHDVGGRTLSKDAFVDGFRGANCHPRSEQERRRLDEASLEVFPLYQSGELYGAIQTGQHYFGATRAHFIHLWLLENGEWRLARGLSYDHTQGVGTAETPSIDRDVISLSRAQLQSYQGRYQFNADFVLTVVEENGKLFGNAQGQSVELFPVAEHQFLDDSKTLELTFVMGDDGRPIEIRMNGRGSQMVGQRLAQ
ncbi:DUF4440 domain-containing protein [Saccharospirillum mangrovi]|uniref:nuclear transport factor 2 family protein n=1 Tax=Saccharospirillum mangrovi TaxID=2161747 RepID=UPI000D36CB38|nr:DUF4440 domain-containing protein [Saccharospirillum mangrovi]